jgi:hypothetical protein
MDGNHEVEPCFQTCLCQGLEPRMYYEFVARCGHYLCMLEKEFPPSFFDIMIHLVLHVVDELDVCGPFHN